MTRKTRTIISLPRPLKKAVEDFAAKNGVSVEDYVARALAEKIGGRRAAEFFTERGKNGDLAWAIALLEGRPE